MIDIKHTKQTNKTLLISIGNLVNIIECYRQFSEQATCIKLQKVIKNILKENKLPNTTFNVSVKCREFSNEELEIQKTTIANILKIK